MIYYIKSEFTVFILSVKHLQLTIICSIAEAPDKYFSAGFIINFDVSKDIKRCLTLIAMFQLWTVCHLNATSESVRLLE